MGQTTESRQRIVVCAEGTWNGPEDDNPSNLLQLARALRAVAADGIRQV